MTATVSTHRGTQPWPVLPAPTRRGRVDLGGTGVAACGRLEFAPPATEPDLLTGKDINGVCAGCHGDDGQGGKDGAYPRIAGLPLAYIYQQVKLFQQNVRPNLAMLEHVHERQLSDQEILDIAAYLSGIKLATRLTPMDEKDPKFNAYERMIERKRIVQIPA